MPFWISAADPAPKSKQKTTQKTEPVKPKATESSQKPKTQASDTKANNKATAQKSAKSKDTSSPGSSTKSTTSAPKLDKATPYEFISAWNALKKADSVKPYYDLLKQVKPEDIKTGELDKHYSCIKK